MVGHRQLKTTPRMKLASHVLHGIVCAQKCLRRYTTQTQDDLGIDDLDLLDKDWQASLTFLWQRISVIRWTMFKNVGDIDIIAGESDGLEDLVQKLAGASYERFALNVLLFPRSLTD